MHVWTYHVSGLAASSGEDEDSLGAGAGLALLEIVAGAGAELTGFEGGLGACGNG